METGSGKTASSWMDAGWREPGPLDADAQVDVCIVGAGIAGMSTAYRLAREGRRVLVLDDGPIGGPSASLDGQVVLRPRDARTIKIPTDGRWRWSGRDEPGWTPLPMRCSASQATRASVSVWLKGACAPSATTAPGPSAPTASAPPW